jgi:hypothetical protein
MCSPVMAALKRRLSGRIEPGPTDFATEPAGGINRCRDIRLRAPSTGSVMLHRLSTYVEVVLNRISRSPTPPR